MIIVSPNPEEPMPTKPATIDAYIAGFPKDAQAVLQKLRGLIRAAVPRVEERISYAIPAFNLDGTYLVYFSAAKEHVGLYPSPMGKTDFDAELKPYASGKATLRFPYDKPLPAVLITRIVKFMAKAAAEKAAKASPKDSAEKVVKKKAAKVK
jgi:uncharacterized protein YdhG (YjbR/CyaY superfamily)